MVDYPTVTLRGPDGRIGRVHPQQVQPLVDLAGYTVVDDEAEGGEDQYVPPPPLSVAPPPKVRRLPGRPRKKLHA